MKRIMGAICLGVAGLALAGCSPSDDQKDAVPAVQKTAVKYVSPKKEAIQDLEYRGILSILYDMDGFYTTWSDSDIRAAIDMTCDGLANNERPEDIRDTITVKFGEASYREAFEVQQVMSASTGVRCEEYTTEKNTIENWDVSPKR
ncbi:hypothetical protein [Paenarthrobacter nicotinovorans]|uniref:hypothetical protein n=1 Tax=Paenarthrobacter nicotinovorans TaxID=29320 RepID=UPI0012DCC8E6|nr:hypothetical protein [Paenarthrobacter nicotinovorans]